MSESLNVRTVAELIRNLKATRLQCLEAMASQLYQDPERALPDQAIMAFLTNVQGTIDALEATLASDPQNEIR